MIHLIRFANLNTLRDDSFNSICKSKTLRDDSFNSICKSKTL